MCYYVATNAREPWLWIIETNIFWWFCLNNSIIFYIYVILSQNYIIINSIIRVNKYLVIK
jgi:hypothetical protein